MKFIKFLPFIFCLFISSSTLIAQSSLDDKNSILYGQDAQYIQTEPMVTKVINADMYDYIFTILKDNLWFVVAICIVVVFILYGVIFFLSFIIRGISKKFDNSEYIEFGKLKIKNRHYKPNDVTTVKEFDVDKFISMLEILLETELSNSISKTIDITNSIHSIETNYTHQCEMIFRNTFSNVKNCFYTELLNYIVKITGFSNSEIHKTKEYFFMNDFLTNVEILWIDHSKDIISRNGFIEIINDKKKASNYIEELDELIWQAIDFKKMEVTVIVKKDLDDILDKVSKETESQLENMFVRLGNLKQNVLEKKNIKLHIIDNEIKESLTVLLDQIRTKFLSPNVSVQNNNEEQQNE